MPKLIQIEGLGDIQFPDDATDQEIGAEVQRLDKQNQLKTQQQAAAKESAVPGAAAEFFKTFVDPNTWVDMPARTGRAVAGAVYDVANMFGGDFSLENSTANITQPPTQPLPSEVMLADNRTLAEITGDARDKADPEIQSQDNPGLYGAAMRGVMGAVKSTPALIAGTAASPFVTPYVAFPALMGWQTYGETRDPEATVHSAATGLLFPLVGKAMQPVGASLGNSLVQNGLIKETSTKALKAVEAAVHQSGFVATAQLLALPEYMEMTPEQRQEAFVEHTAGLLAFAIPDAIKVYDPKQYISPNLARKLAEESIKRQMQKPAPTTYKPPRSRQVPPAPPSAPVPPVAPPEPTPAPNPLGEPLPPLGQTPEVPAAPQPRPPEPVNEVPPAEVKQPAPAPEVLPPVLEAQPPMPTPPPQPEPPAERPPEPQETPATPSPTRPTPEQRQRERDAERKQGREEWDDRRNQMPAPTPIQHVGPGLVPPGFYRVTDELVLHPDGKKLIQDAVDRAQRQIDRAWPEMTPEEKDAWYRGRGLPERFNFPFETTDAPPAAQPSPPPQEPVLPIIPPGLFTTPPTPPGPAPASPPAAQPPGAAPNPLRDVTVVAPGATPDVPPGFAVVDAGPKGQFVFDPRVLSPDAVGEIASRQPDHPAATPPPALTPTPTANEPQPTSSNPPGVDVQQPAGPGAPAPQPGEAGGPSGRQAPGRPPAGEPTGEPRPSGPRGGVAGGGRNDPGASRQPGEQRPPAPADAGPGEKPTPAPTDEVAPQPPAGTDKPYWPTARPPEALDYVVPQEGDWLPKGLKTKARANWAAITVLKNVEQLNRPASRGEQKLMAQYTGWGALSQMLNENMFKIGERIAKNQYVFSEQRQQYEKWKKEWGEEAEKLRGLLTDQEWNDALVSTINSHYTSRTVVNAMWQALERMGFKGGKVLEPAVGTGNFIGLAPESLRNNMRWTAVELDSLTSRIAAKLYPNATHINSGFEAARIPNNSQDLVISNVPFAKDGPKDARYPQDLSLHNYFFARAMDVVRPGGVVAFITSMSTMDAPRSRVLRDMLRDRADLVGAVRLPNTAFKENAGTEVTTDILFLRKRDAHSFPVTPWQGTTDVAVGKDRTLPINEYFARQPDMMLGRMSDEGSMYSKGEPTLEPISGAELSQQLQEAMAKLPTDVFRPKLDAGKQAEQVVVPATFKQGRLAEVEGKFGTADANGVFEPVEWGSDNKLVDQARRYVKVRDATVDIIDAMRKPDASEADLEARRRQLNKLYDEYVAKHGAINEKGSEYLDVDVDFPLMMALEVENIVLAPSGKRRVIQWKKSDIFSKRTIVPIKPPPASVDRLTDAIDVSLNYVNRLDTEYVAKLLGKPVEEAQREMRESGEAFEDPVSGQWQVAEEYLSGPVRDKLKQAKAAAETDSSFDYNVAALTKALPADVPLDEVRFKLGSTWVPPQAIERFIDTTLGLKAKVTYVSDLGQYTVEMRHKQSYENNVKYASHGLSATDLIEKALNLKAPEIYEGKGEDRVKRQDWTLEAIEAQRVLNDAFVDFVKSEAPVKALMQEAYNNTYNNIIPPTFRVPSWKHYPGASNLKELRPHQKQVVSRMLRNSVLMAHAVGAGKTYAMITGAMEMRRLGLAKKPMIVVQGATLEQFPRDFKTLYPNARLLVPNPKMRKEEYRNATMSRIATGEYDAIIVPHTWFERLPDSFDRQRKYLQEEIELLKLTLQKDLAGRNEKSPAVKAVAKQIKNLQEKLAKLMKDRPKDEVLTFEQLGVDALYVDEAHRYKGLPISSKMDRIKGLNVEESKRALSLYMKTRHVQEQNGGRNVILATGTPISNSLSETHTMMRYVRPDVLDAYKIKIFDSFAAAFTRPETKLEPTPTGHLEFITRLSSFQNGPELLRAWLTAADVIIPEQIKFENMPVLKTGATIANELPPTPRLKEYIRALHQELLDFQAMSPKERKENSHIPLVVQTKARKAALDMRMIDASLPDEPGSKLNVAAERIATIYRDSTSVKGTQMVFSDSMRDSAEGHRFHVYEELKRKLIQRGIPEGEILIVDETMKDARRDAAFQKLNAGGYRIAIGHSERMGVGVNAQKHMIALHHLDPPWKPMYVEQRNGRVLRQGNLNPEIQIHSYGVQGTIDATMYSLLETKQRMINQILRGQMSGRHFEDPSGDAVLSFEAQLAAYSGDKRMVELLDLQQKIKQWETLRNAHLAKVRQNAIDVPRLQEAREQAVLRQAQSQKFADSVASAFAGVKDWVLSAQQGGTPISKTGRVEIAEWVEKATAATRDAERADWTYDREAQKWVAPVSGMDGVTINGLPITVDAVMRSIRNDDLGGHFATTSDKKSLEFAVTIGNRNTLPMFSVLRSQNPIGFFKTGVGLLQSMETVLEKIADRPKQVGLDIAQIERGILSAQQGSGEFPHQTKLDEAKVRAAELDRQLKDEAQANTDERARREGRRPDDPPDDGDVESLDMMGDRGVVESAVADVRRIQRLVAPQTQNATSREVANMLRERGAEMAKQMARADHALRKFRRQFDRTVVPKEWQYDPTLPLPRNYAFIDAYERGNTGRLLAAGDAALAAELHRMNDADVGRVQALGTGALDTFYRHYFPHIWDNPKAAARMVERILTKSPLQGPATFLKQRTHMFFEEGLRAGLRPVHDNPIDLWLLKKREVERFILGHKAVNELKSLGVVKFKHVFKRMPEGYTTVDDRAFQVYGPPTVTIKEAFDAALREGIMDAMRKLGVPHSRLVKIGGQGTWGKMEYVPGKKGTEAITSKFGGPDYVLAHELGHVIGVRYNDFRTTMEATPAMETEVQKLASLRTNVGSSAKFRAYVMTPAEREAVIWQAYLYAPELMAKTAPTVLKALENFITRHPELDMLRNIRPGLRLGEAEAEVAHGGLLKMGDYIMPEQAAKVFNNYLSPGLNTHGWYRGVREIGNLLNGVQLGLSAFHLGFTSLDAAVSRLAVALEDASRGKVKRAVVTALSSGVAPVTNAITGHRLRAEVLRPGSHAGMAVLARALEQAGGRIAQDDFWQTNFTRRMKRAWAEGGLQMGKAVGMAPFALWEQTMRPILEFVVPRQKLGVFADMAKRELEKLGPNANEADTREAMRKAWDSVDNRMGQVVYDNLFYNRVVKDIALLSFRAYGWQLGKYREAFGALMDAGQAVRDVGRGEKPELTHRMAYAVALPMMVGTLGAVVHYLFTGKAPEDLRDYFQPRTGELDRNGNPVRVNLPSYVKDFLHYAKHPIDSFGNSLHPVWHAMFELLQNRDYFDTQIRNPEDPLLTQGGQMLRYAGSQFVPFSVSGIQKLKEQGSPAWKFWAPYVGITPVPMRMTMTPAQELSAEIMQGFMPSAPRTREDADERTLLKQLVDDLKRGQADPARRQAALKLMADNGARLAETLTPERLVVLAKQVGYTPLQFQVHMMPADYALKVWAIASDDERRLLAPIMASKLGRTHDKKAIKRAVELLNTPR